MRIGALSQATATAVDTIRHYEREGLLRAPPRSDGNYRVYTADDVSRLNFIRRCRGLDMSLAEVRQLLALADGDHCAEVNALLDEHIGHVAARIASLQALEAELRALRARCDGAGEACGILGGLAEQRDVVREQKHEPEARCAGGVHGARPRPRA